MVQLYLRDRVASLVRPLKELKGFNKILLQPGKNKIISFIIAREQLSFYNSALQWVAEPGQFDIMIGGASNNIQLTTTIELTDG